VEAAALGGRPVGFLVSGPWLKPWRMSEPSPRGQNATIIILCIVVAGVLVGAALLARSNLRAGRGDRRGAARLAVFTTAIMLALWICEVHLVASLGLFAMLLLAICTTVFNGFLLWTLYMALEPFVRRRWPQVLVSWTNVLTGRLRDPVVGRDVLLGVALGVAWTLMIRVLDLTSGGRALSDFPGEVALLSGLRPTLGVMLESAPNAIRNVLFFFFLLFVLRVVLRREWAAVLGFAGLFMLLDLLGNQERPLIAGLMTFLYFGSGAVVVVRWGLLSYAVGHFVTDMLMNITATLDGSTWYFGNMLVLLGIVVALAVWGFYTSLGGRLWATETLTVGAASARP
jgi:hypothetical protein